MQLEQVRPLLSEVLGTMTRTTDGRAVRHVVRRFDEAMQQAGVQPAVREALIQGCREVADTIAQRQAPAARGRAK